MAERCFTHAVRSDAFGHNIRMFTDSVTNTGNVIQAGNLDAELRYRDVKESDPKAEYTTVTDETPALFGNQNGNRDTHMAMIFV